MRLVFKLLITVLTLFIVEYLVPGFKFDSYQAILVTSVVLGIINILIKPVIQIIAIPITLLTFGVFAFVINVLLLYLTSFLVPGFEISSFGTAVASSILISIVSWFLQKLAKE